MKTDLKRGPHKERSERTRALLTAAAVELIADLGLSAVSLAGAEARAGLRRGVAAHHFQGRAHLVNAAAEQLLVAAPVADGYGIDAIEEWGNAWRALQNSSSSAAAALLRVALDVGAGQDFAELRRRYWEVQANPLVERLSQIQGLGRLNPALEPSTAAILILDCLHGQLRRGASEPANADAQSSLLEIALSVCVQPAAPKLQRKKAPPSTNASQGDLLNDI